MPARTSHANPQSQAPDPTPPIPHSASPCPAPQTSEPAVKSEPQEQLCVQTALDDLQKAPALLASRNASPSESDTVQSVDKRELVGGVKELDKVKDAAEEQVKLEDIIKQETQEDAPHRGFKTRRYGLMLKQSVALIISFAQMRTT